MKIPVARIYTISLTAILGIVAYIFFGFYYPGHLYYQEQFQLFLFDSYYFNERIATPDGLAEYIGEFFTQFYYHAWVGAIVIALLLMLYQLLTWRVSCLFKKVEAFYPLSFIPTLLMFALLCDENSMLTFLIACILALLYAYTMCLTKRFIVRIVATILSLPLLYWCIGGAFFIAVVLLSAYEIKRSKNRSGVIGSLAILAVGIACPFIAKIWVQYPLVNLYTGIGYYRFPAVLPYLFILTVVVTIAIPLLFILLPSLSSKQLKLIVPIQIAAIAFFGAYLTKQSSDMSKEEAMVYDYLAKKQRWEQIITKAERKSPRSPLSVVCLNLALGRTGTLGERMFEFYQRNTEGLLTSFQRDFTSPLPASEAFYHLGMINTAQRYTFEAMEAIPNYRKSTRCYKRLAETNLINGEYEVAEKYIRALTNSLYYRKWANNALTYLYNDEKINNHPEWGTLRRYRYQNDFLYSPHEMDKMLGLLLTHNIANKMAFEYMLGYTLLNRDIDSFMKYYSLGQNMRYRGIPRSYQEALIFAWSQQHSSLDEMPWAISPQVKNAVSTFARMYSQQTDSKKTLKEKFGDTYWNYLLLNN